MGRQGIEKNPILGVKGLVEYKFVRPKFDRYNIWCESSRTESLGRFVLKRPFVSRPDCVVSRIKSAVKL